MILIVLLVSQATVDASSTNTSPRSDSSIKGLISTGSAKHHICGQSLIHTD